MNTTYSEVVESFESTFQDKRALAEGLVKQWLLDSIGEFCLEIDTITYDKTLNEFTSELPQWQITSIALMMKIKYCTREVSRVNKLNNITGKDISFNATGDTKKYTKDELDSEILRLTKMLDNQKPTAYV